MTPDDPTRMGFLDHPLTATARRQSARALKERFEKYSRSAFACQIQRAAAAPVSSGRVLKAMGVCGAARWTALTTASNSISCRAVEVVCNGDILETSFSAQCKLL